MKRKHLLVMLCALLVCALFAGCGKKDDKEQNASDVNAGEAGTGAENAGKDTEQEVETLPAKVWDSPDDYRVVENYVVPEEIADSKFDMEAALTAIPLKEAAAPYFKFGMAMTGNQASTFAVKSPEMRELLKYHCNTTTATNLMKPQYMLVQAECKKASANGIEDPVLDFAVTDEALAFCRENGIGMRGHTLVWHAQTPDWFFRVGYDENNEYVDAETMKYRLESYIRQMLTHCQEKYPGVVYCWDVVNECVEVGDREKESGWYCRTSGHSPNNTNQWYDILGYEYVELAFTYARKYAAPGVSLVYNDYNTQDSTKCAAICELLKYLKGKGLIDAFGMQCNLSVDVDLSKIFYTIVQYAKTGLELQVTELNIVAADTSEESYKIQADAYYKFMKFVMASDDSNGGSANITVVNVFSLMDGYLLYASDSNNYCLFDKDIQPKPNYYSIIDAIVQTGKHNTDILK